MLLHQHLNTMVEHVSKIFNHLIGLSPWLAGRSMARTNCPPISACVPKSWLTLACFFDFFIVAFFLCSIQEAAEVSYSQFYTRSLRMPYC